jgi:hypothetical protein
MTSPLVVQVAGPHPAAVCLLPATSPDDGATLSALPDADALFERLSFRGCFPRGDGCACLARNNLCDELRGLLYLPAGTPGLDDACGVSCAKPLPTSGASCQASAAASRHHPAPALVLGLFASAGGFTEAIGSSAERGCAGPGLVTPAWAPVSPSPATRSIRTPAEEYPTFAEVCAAGLAAVAAHAEGWLTMAMDYHSQVMMTA